MLRVIHLVRSMEVGGLERVVADLVEAGCDCGITPFLGCLLEPGARGESVECEGLWVGGLEETGSFRTIRSLCDYVRENEIDIIHTHNPQPHKFGVAAGLLCRVPVVHTKHGRNYPDDKKRVWLNRQLSRYTAKLVAVSEDVARVAVEIEKVPPGKVVVIRNGVRVNRSSDTMPQGGVRGIARLWKRHRKRNKVTIGSVGRLSEEKNYALLIDAFVVLNNRLRHFCGGALKAELLFVGDGPERADLEKRVEGAGLQPDQVRFAGMQTNVGEWLNRMDIFCLSSDTEGTSMTLLEAGAAGIPGVVTDVGGNGEIVANGVSGLVVPPGDAEALAAALFRLAVDYDLRIEMGASARDRVAELYSLEEMVKQYCAVWRDAVGD